MSHPHQTASSDKFGLGPPSEISYPLHEMRKHSSPKVSRALKQNNIKRSPYQER
jgi:hypothetical protein